MSEKPFEAPIGKPTMGAHAMGIGAMVAGLDYFAGYPITPQTELLEYVAEALPEHGGVFQQLGDEISSVMAVFGAAACGKRAMTASVGPGLTLMIDGLTNAAGAETPMVLGALTRAHVGVSGGLYPAQVGHPHAPGARQRRLPVAALRAGDDHRDRPAHRRGVRRRRSLQHPGGGLHRRQDGEHDRDAAAVRGAGARPTGQDLGARPFAAGEAPGGRRRPNARTRHDGLLRDPEQARANARGGDPLGHLPVRRRRVRRGRLRHHGEDRERGGQAGARGRDQGRALPADHPSSRSRRRRSATSPPAPGRC